MRLVAPKTARSHVPEEASHAFLVNWFFSKFSLLLFVYNFFSKVFKIPHKFSHICCHSYKLY